MLKKIVISLLICLSLSSINIFACTTMLNVTNSYNITSPVTYDCVYVQNGGTLKADYPLNVTKEMIIYSGGIVTHTGSQTSDTYRVNITAVNLTINSGGSIDVNSKGYYINYGPGAGGSSTGLTHSGGGAYGGDAGDGADRVGGLSYGSLYEPTQLGSGGGSNGYGLAGSGGGTIILSVSDTLITNGVLTANGGNGADATRDAGAGAGGSIYITAPNISGNSSITSNGGSTGTSGGAGSGGRIALYYDTLSSDLTITAYGGNNGYRSGAAGTIYKKSSSQTYGNLIIDNNNANNHGTNQYDTNTYFSESVTFDSILINNYGIFEIQSGQSIVTTNLKITNTGVLRLSSGSSIDYSILNWSDSGIISDFNGTIPLLASNTDLTVPSGVQLDLNVPRVFDSVIVNGEITTRASQTSDLYRINMTAVNLTINSGGSINVKGTGYSINYGPGAGTSGGLADTGGGAYGGDAGDGVNTAGGNAYGNLYRPTQLGSGGGSCSYSSAGQGGGTILLNISDTLTVNGVLDANGIDATSGTRDAGGGAGGSIYISAPNILGDSNITANGGWAAAEAGGGSGGRIALYYDTLSSDLTITAYGGNNGYRSGAAGTIYKKSSSQTYGDLIIDNNNANNHGSEQYDTRTYLSDSYVFDSILINNYALFGLHSASDVFATEVVLNNSAGIVMFSGGLLNYSSFDWQSTGIIVNYGGNIPVLTHDLVIDSGKKLVSNAPLTLDSFILNGTLTHRGKQTTDVYRINLTILENMTINSGGIIDVDGMGYYINYGPGAGTSGGLAHTGGGAYGGDAGDGTDTAGGDAYGSFLNPIQFGSGGGSCSYSTAGSGGGTIILNVSDTLTVNGKFTANGIDATDGIRDAGGGAGGTVFIRTNILKGSANISANGGFAYSGGGGGSGGRIAIYTQNNTYTGSTSTNGGTGGNDGGAGTIFTCTSIDGVTNCHNSSTGINLDVSYNTTKSMTVKRTVNTLWSNNLVQWQDIGSGVTNNYTISGLKSNTLYNIYENSTLSTSLTTNSEGILPTFTISLYGTHDLLVSEDSTIPETEEESVNFFPFGSLISIFSSLSAIFLYSVFRKQSY